MIERKGGTLLEWSRDEHGPESAKVFRDAETASALTSSQRTDSSGRTRVSMMQTTHLRNRDDLVW